MEAACTNYFHRENMVKIYFLRKQKKLYSSLHKNLYSFLNLKLQYKKHVFLPPPKNNGKSVFLLQHENDIIIIFIPASI